MSDLAHRGAVPPDPTRQAAQRLLEALAQGEDDLDELWMVDEADVRLVAEAVTEAPASGRANTKPLFPTRRRALSWGRAPGLFWVRVFGRGFHVRDTARHPLRFSERNGHTQMWTIRRLR